MGPECKHSGHCKREAQKSVDKEGDVGGSRLDVARSCGEEILPWKLHKDQTLLTHSFESLKAHFGFLTSRSVRKYIFMLF